MFRTFPKFYTALDGAVERGLLPPGIAHHRTFDDSKRWAPEDPAGVAFKRFDAVTDAVHAQATVMAFLGA